MVEFVAAYVLAMIVTIVATYQLDLSAPAAFLCGTFLGSGAFIVAAARL